MTGLRHRPPSARVTHNPQIKAGPGTRRLAAEHLSDQHPLVPGDLVSGPGALALADVPVAKRGARQHVHRPVAAGTVGLLAGLHLLGEHALERHQQAGPRGCPRACPSRIPPAPRPGRAPRSTAPGRRTCGRGGPGVAQDHVHASLRGQVAPGLQPGPDQRGPECPSSSDTQSSGPQAGSARHDCAAPRSASRPSGLLLPGAGHPGRRSPRWSRAAFLPGWLGSGPAAAVREWRRPPVPRPATAPASAGPVQTPMAGPGPAVKAAGEALPPRAANAAAPIATPNTPPSWRKVLNVPDALPIAAGGTADITVLCAGGRLYHHRACDVVAHGSRPGVSR